MASNGTVVGVSGAGGGGVGVALANIFNFYMATPDEIKTDVLIVATFVLAYLAAIIAHLLTRVDLDHDGKPDLAPPPNSGSGT